ncbi:trigger factor [Defluviitalea raffinosedens]|uniref:Trigger factor n=1 Tax=Defluviitalea raffinosedens TaxID=1450156 RepID=A0A7C8HGN6_9FIRM|nr:trigger factor [Defluviitalea raffinosedens]KAE9634394.1 trigger factor [Defluviitalea raffinosedens]
MSSQLERLENNQVKLTIGVSAEKFEEGMQYAFNKNKKHISIPGFRKGKAPRAFVEKMYGPEIFYEDAINYVIPEVYEAAIKEHNLEVVSRPEFDVETIEKGKDVVLTAVVTVKPEVTLGQYKEVEVPKMEIEVKEEEIEEELKRVQEQNARIITVTDRPVKDGDEVVIDFEGFIDGEAFEGGKGTDYTLKIGSHTFIDTFEEQLIGARPGDNLEVNVTFPENYHQKDLAGRPALFKVEIKEIKEKELPALDDEFAKDVSEFETLDEYKKDIKAKLLEQKEKAAKLEKERNALEKVIENAKMDVPEVMIDNQIDQMVQDFSMRMRYQGLPVEQYLQFTGQTMEKLRENFRSDAEFQVKARLVLEEIAKVENIEVTDEELNDEFKRMAEQYQMELDKLLSNVGDAEKEAIREDIKIRKAVDLVVDSAKEAN